MMKTINEIKWKRGFSAFNDTIIFPAGTLVSGNDKIGYWISPSALDNRYMYDLTYHGCSVDKDNISHS